MSEYANVSGRILEIGGGKVLAPGEKAAIEEPPRRLIESGRLVEVKAPKAQTEDPKAEPEKQAKTRAKRGKPSESEKETGHDAARD